MGAVLIIGNPGTGKSTSIRTLDPTSTFIISILDKPLPFRGGKKIYKPITGWSDMDGNYFASTDWQRILKCIELVNKNERIKTLVVDDIQYLMAHEFMTRASEKGFDKFSEIGQHMYHVTQAAINMRPDIITFVMSHSDTDNAGRIKCKTIGKMLEEKLSLEGMYTTVLHSVVHDDKYKFLTQTTNDYLAKSPMGMFSELLIDNDLKNISDAIKTYYEED